MRPPGSIGQRGMVALERLERQARLARLRARIARIERGGAEQAVCPLGVPAIDGALPWGGLPRGALHEIGGVAERDLAAQGFAAALLGLLARDGRPVLWIAPDEGPYAPALPGLGLAPAQVTVVRARRPADALWALEEGLRCPTLAAVLAEGPMPDFAQSRRLQLAARESGVTALLLQPAREPLPASAAVTRWRVAAAPSAPEEHDAETIGETVGETIGETVGYARWRLDLLRARGGRPRHWLVEWSHEPDETHRLAVAADAGDRPDRTAAADEAA
jgi:protein ImuA